MTEAATELTPHQALAAFMSEHGLTIAATFVPFSQSRNAKPNTRDGKPWRSLNWRVELRKAQRVGAASQGGEYDSFRVVLATDYSAGEAHAPSYKQHFGRKTLAVQERQKAVERECEMGFPVKWWNGEPQFNSGPDTMRGAIMPDAVDVFSSLCMNADALDHATFETWAADYCYDADSRSAEKVYRACLEIALQLRAALGDGALTQARNLASEL